MPKRIIAVSVLCICLVFNFPAFAQNFVQEAKECYEKGNEYYKQGKYKEAQEEFDKALFLMSRQQEKEKQSASKEEVKKAIAPPQEKPTVSEVTPQPSKVPVYTINSDDVLFISVWQNNDLNQEIIVRPDGMISFPLIGDVPAMGLTIPQLTDLVKIKLKEYIKYPEVSISVKKMAGKKVIVLGEVDTQGVYSITSRTTILEAIALAGGLTNDAVMSSVILIRGGFDKPKGMRLNLERAISKTDMSQNIALQPEDIIYVPKKFIANVSYFVDQVIGPISDGIFSVDSTQKLIFGP